MTKIAFFVSGNGTNMENLVKEIQAGRVPQAEARLVLSDNKAAAAIEKAKKLGIEVVVVDRKKYAASPEFEAALKHELEVRGIDLILLAGGPGRFSYHYIATRVKVNPLATRRRDHHDARIPCLKLFDGCGAIPSRYVPGDVLGIVVC